MGCRSSKSSARNVQKQPQTQQINHQNTEETVAVQKQKLSAITAAKSLPASNGLVDYLVNNARLKFQESYWQTVLGGGPPPQIEMIMVVHKSKLVLSMAAGSGQLQFVTNTNKLNIEELFFRVVKEGLGVGTKNLFVNAILSHVISIQHPSVGTEVIDVAALPPTSLATEDRFYFEHPEGDTRNNCRLRAFNASNQSPQQSCDCYMEHNQQGGVIMGGNQFRYNLLHISTV